jgi:serine/threonine protein phosphatase PrpC
MGEAIELVDLRKQSYPLQTDDIVILASDGVETLANNELSTVLCKSADSSLQTLADNLMTSIEAAGRSGQDNASVILYRHREAGPPAPGNAITSDTN